MILATSQNVMEAVIKGLQLEGNPRRSANVMVKELKLSNRTIRRILKNEGQNL